MGRICLRPLRRRDHRLCLRLKVRNTQRTFVHSTRFSLEEAKTSTVPVLLLGIWRGRRLIGFAMVRYQPCGVPGISGPAYEIARFLIDRRYQGRGYGAAAFRQLLAFLRTLPLGPAGAVFLFCNQKNTVGWNLYGVAGFRQTRIFNTLHERLAVTCIS